MFLYYADPLRIVIQLQSRLGFTLVSPISSDVDEIDEDSGAFHYYEGYVKTDNVRKGIKNLEDKMYFKVNRYGFKHFMVYAIPADGRVDWSRIGTIEAAPTERAVNAMLMSNSVVKGYIFRFYHTLIEGNERLTFPTTLGVSRVAGTYLSWSIYALELSVLEVNSSTNSLEERERRGLNCIYASIRVAFNMLPLDADSDDVLRAVRGITGIEGGHKTRGRYLKKCRSVRECIESLYHVATSAWLGDDKRPVDMYFLLKNAKQLPDPARYFYETMFLLANYDRERFLPEYTTTVDVSADGAEFNQAKFKLNNMSEFGWNKDEASGDYIVYIDFKATGAVANLDSWVNSLALFNHENTSASHPRKKDEVWEIALSEVE